jgi:hypothetical protein
VPFPFRPPDLRRADGGKRVCERLSLIHAPSQLDRPGPPCDRLVEVVLDQPEACDDRVGHRELVPRWKLLEYADGLLGGLLRLRDAADRPQEACLPPQRVSLAQRIAEVATNGECLFPCGESLLELLGHVAVVRVLLEQLGPVFRWEVGGESERGSVERGRLAHGRSALRPVSSDRCKGEDGLGVAGRLSVVHDARRVLLALGRRQRLERCAVQHPSAVWGNRALDGQPRELVAETHGVVLRH